MPLILHDANESGFKRKMLTDQLDEVFISYLLTAVEADENPYDPENTIPTMFVKCLLSLNLHYKGRYYSYCR